jgi:hypothetical protein
VLMRLLLALLLLAPGMAWGQVVMVCPQASAAGGNRFSCESWQIPKAVAAATDLVLRCDWSAPIGSEVSSCGAQTWVQFQSSEPEKLILSGSRTWMTKPGGTVAPPPPPNPPPTSGATGTGELTWGAATRNVDGTAIRPPVTYRVTVSGCAARVIEPAVSPLTIAGLPAGSCFATIATRSADGYSAELGPVSWVVAAAPPPPPPPPPQQFVQYDCIPSLRALRGKVLRIPEAVRDGTDDLVGIWYCQRPDRLTGAAVTFSLADALPWILGEKTAAEPAPLIGPGPLRDWIGVQRNDGGWRVVVSVNGTTPTRPVFPKLASGLRGTTAVPNARVAVGATCSGIRLVDAAGAATAFHSVQGRPNVATADPADVLGDVYAMCTVTAPSTGSVN